MMGVKLKEIIFTIPQLHDLGASPTDAAAFAPIDLDESNMRPLRQRRRLIIRAALQA
jgi:hypothetical protein